MDLGLAFEDEDLQCDEKNIIGDRHVPYNVKICSSQWFENAAKEIENDEDTNEVLDLEQQMQILKFSADLHYQQKDYQTALTKYKKLLNMMSSKTNSALWHDAQESLSRCCIYIGLTDEGLKVARELVAVASRGDEAKQRQALQLLSFACERVEKWTECVDALERLCELQSQFPQIWHKLGDVYSHIYSEDHANISFESTSDDVLLVKQLSSYLRAKLLFQSVMGTANGFVKDRNVAMVLQLNSKIDQVPISKARKDFASEFIHKEVENQVTFKDFPSFAQKDDSGRGTFYEKFCSWNALHDR